MIRAMRQVGLMIGVESRQHADVPVQIKTDKSATAMPSEMTLIHTPIAYGPERILSGITAI